MAKVILLACLFIGITTAYPSRVISSSLMKKLQSKQPVDITVIMKENVNKIHSDIQEQEFEERSQKMTSLRSSLIAHSEESQRPVRQHLEAQKINFRSHWVSNRITIRNISDISAIEEIAKISQVKEIREMKVMQIGKKREIEKVAEPKQNTNQWGVEKINAHRLWAGGNRGQGIIVATIDTGARGTHSILASNYRGPYGWFDPYGSTAAPRDGNGQGTHVMGILAGQNGYGVAPGAQWMSCQGCTNSCYEDDLLDCGQFISCPTLNDGSVPDCSKAPHVVSNSWGSSMSADPWFDDVIRLWHQAGVIPVFSIGNGGNGCETVGSPGDRDGVIGVGGTDEYDFLGTFSSNGPSWDMRLKPDITAPGYLIESAYYNNDTSFRLLSGTSMACPHVAGAIALLLVERPNLVGDYNGIRAALFDGAQKQGLTGSGRNCEGVDENTFPNFAFGYGRLDIQASSRTTKNVTHWF